LVKEQYGAGLQLEAFGGVGYSAVDPQGLATAPTEALASGKPALIKCAINQTAGTESGHIGNFNPQSSIPQKQ
jgi:oxalyl-CoA decarboxylase